MYRQSKIPWIFLSLLALLMSSSLLAEQLRYNDLDVKTSNNQKRLTQQSYGNYLPAPPTSQNRSWASNRHTITITKNQSSISVQPDIITLQPNTNNFIVFQNHTHQKQPLIVEFPEDSYSSIIKKGFLKTMGDHYYELNPKYTNTITVMATKPEVVQFFIPEVINY